MTHPLRNIPVQPHKYLIRKTHPTNQDFYTPGGYNLESHSTLEQATRALNILNEHEERCGRGPNFWEIRPPLKENQP